MLLDVDDYCKPTWYAVIKFLIKTIQEKVLGVTLDNKRNFAAHLWNITKNADKFNALMCVQKYMTTDQKSLEVYGCSVQIFSFAE